MKCLLEGTHHEFQCTKVLRRAKLFVQTVKKVFTGKLSATSLKNEITLRIKITEINLRIEIKEITLKLEVKVPTIGETKLPSFTYKTTG
jgi:hypothetical protein